MFTACFTVIARFNGSTPRHYDYLTIEGVESLKRDSRYEVLDVERQEYSMEMVSEGVASCGTAD